MNNPDLQNLELSIVIPLYNERDNLIPLEDKLETELSKLNLSYEIILIDDGKRKDDSNTVNRWISEWCHFESEFITTEKGAYILRKR